MCSLRRTFKVLSVEYANVARVLSQKGFLSPNSQPASSSLILFSTPDMITGTHEHSTHTLSQFTQNNHSNLDNFEHFRREISSNHLSVHHTMHICFTDQTTRIFTDRFMACIYKPRRRPNYEWCLCAKKNRNHIPWLCSGRYKSYITSPRSAKSPTRKA